MSKPIRIILAIVIGMALFAVIFSSGIAIGVAVTAAPEMQKYIPFVNPSTEQAAAPDTNLDVLFEPFWESWNLVHDQYVEQPVNDTELMRGAIRGMLDSLGDPHTSYMDPEEYAATNAPLNGEYEGIGAWVDISGDYLAITSPMPGSPAEKAGLRPNDLVIAVDGEDMTGVDGDLVLLRVLGPAGTDVVLTIQREGEEEPFDVTITRAKIEVPSISGEMLEDNVAYVQISTFGIKTNKELRDILAELLAQDPVGLIVDLRYNGGGYLNTSVDVMSQFIEGDQVVLYEEMGDGSRTIYRSKKGGLATEIPLVVLINEGSASASEIFAGAIQDYERGTLVGITTYGKGSVQNWIPLMNDQGAVRVTIARWLTPDERHIHNIGIDPDIEVEITEEDFEAERDSQLEKAIEILTESE
ncbi:MAG: S41 family peptidase [Anaerolineaceae bacterium]|jgi:carboxyl-terminal processing protease|nr:S41 family peptidase [Anaerolineaceae bacterium]